MVYIYGKSDAETQLLEYLKGKFRIIEINSLENWNEFSKYPEKVRKELVELKEKEEIDCKNRLDYLKNGKQELIDRLGIVNSEITRKYTVLKRVPYGSPTAYSILDEIEALKTEKEDISRAQLPAINQDISALYALIPSLQREVDNLVYEINRDINRLYELKDDITLKKLLSGAWGEKEVIRFIEESFKNEKEFHLINGLNIDLLGKATRYNDSTLTENRIDHIILCPKGVYVLETKAWAHLNDKSSEVVLNQIRKTKKVLEEEVLPPHTTKVNYLIICTKKLIEIPHEGDIRSIILGDLKSSILTKDDKLPRQEIYAIRKQLIGMQIPLDIQISKGVSVGVGKLKEIFKRNR